MLESLFVMSAFARFLRSRLLNRIGALCLVLRFSPPSGRRARAVSAVSRLERSFVNVIHTTDAKSGEVFLH